MQHRWRSQAGPNDWLTWKAIFKGAVRPPIDCPSYSDHLPVTGWRILLIAEKINRNHRGLCDVPPSHSYAMSQPQERTIFCGGERSQVRLELTLKDKKLVTCFTVTVKCDMHVINLWAHDDDAAHKRNMCQGKVVRHLGHPTDQRLRWVWSLNLMPRGVRHM